MQADVRVEHQVRDDRHEDVVGDAVEARVAGSRHAPRSAHARLDRRLREQLLPDWAFLKSIITMVGRRRRSASSSTAASDTHRLPFSCECSRRPRDLCGSRFVVGAPLAYCRSAVVAWPTVPTRRCASTRASSRWSCTAAPCSSRATPSPSTLSYVRRVTVAHSGLL